MRKIELGTVMSLLQADDNGSTGFSSNLENKSNLKNRPQQGFKEILFSRDRLKRNSAPQHTQTVEDIDPVKAGTGKKDIYQLLKLPSAEREEKLQEIPEEELQELLQLLELPNAKKLKRLLKILIESKELRNQQLAGMSVEELTSLQRLMEIPFTEFIQKLKSSGQLSSEIEELGVKWQQLRGDLKRRLKEMTTELSDGSNNDSSRLSGDEPISNMSVEVNKTDYKTEYKTGLAESISGQDNDQAADEVSEVFLRKGKYQELLVDLLSVGKEEKVNKIKEMNPDLIQSLKQLLQNRSPGDLKSLINLEQINLEHIKKSYSDLQSILSRFSSKNGRMIDQGTKTGRIGQDNKSDSGPVNEVNNIDNNEVNKVDNFKRGRRADFKIANEGNKANKHLAVNKGNPEIQQDTGQVNNGRRLVDSSLFSNSLIDRDIGTTVRAEGQADGNNSNKPAADLLASLKSFLMEKEVNNDKQANTGFRESGQLFGREESITRVKHFLSNSGANNHTGDFSSLMNQDFSMQIEQGIDGNTKTAGQLNMNQVIEQITDQLKLSHKSGSDRIEMQLEPEFLGKVKLDLKVKAGRVTAKFMVDNLYVKNHLEQNIQVLKSSLIKQGFNIDQLDVETTGYDSEPQQDSGSRQEFNQQYNPGEERGKFSFDQEALLNLSPGQLEDILEMTPAELAEMRLKHRQWFMNNYVYRGMNLLA